ncbi:hypothetical protein PILCRDRAFT_179694 [Piloderma croceum F 1598]|uniref:Uncharacterized protein n=1 Tax=Piloderma croceum (strain F 1598) TaxID=765440 RepID=A0A0C3GI51_PILCF|nr:hypothetical protein PILCRDRAFT_179694 [Piloderma croceum F 1598]
MLSGLFNWRLDRCVTFSHNLFKAIYINHVQDHPIGLVFFCLILNPRSLLINLLYYFSKHTLRARRTMFLPLGNVVPPFLTDFTGCLWWHSPFELYKIVA